MNLLYEEGRINFVIIRDGKEEGVLFAKRLTKTYLEACKMFRRKYHTRYHPLREAYLQSAFSARHIVRGLK